MQINKSTGRIILSCSLLLGAPVMSSCSLFSPAERIVYDQQGIRIGLEPDPTLSRSAPLTLNRHPAELSVTELEALLRVIQVSGWSGTLVGILSTPQPIPLFTPKELAMVSGKLVAAFRQATPTERIFFSLPKPDVAYSEDRTVGALFMRGRYLHVVVQDHAAFIQADTGGGELKDLRDTKGMKLSVAGPAQAAMVPDLEEPQWAPFETVHLSLNIKDVLAHLTAPLPARTIRSGAELPPAALQKTGSAAAPSDELQLQIRELTSSNLELRSRLDDQKKKMEELNAQMERLRLELDQTKSKKQPSRTRPTP
ncbi:hypothetical protein [Nitrospira lenta]|uniref:Lipoprotein n=1 Tax=Nitrospira lenta TaxID=1436998 RepID=A0A330L5I2_9BACT|nr:hypothetical protein [Nitrospira lenta]SPP65099.1 conserved exported hypothetical protein [Nitrospira lenta]